MSNSADTQDVPSLLRRLSASDSYWPQGPDPNVLQMKARAPGGTKKLCNGLSPARAGVRSDALE